MLKKFYFFLKNCSLVFSHLVPYSYSALASQDTSGPSPIPSHYCTDKGNSELNLPLFFLAISAVGLLVWLPADTPRILVKVRGFLAVLKISDRLI